MYEMLTKYLKHQKKFLNKEEYEKVEESAKELKEKMPRLKEDFNNIVAEMVKYINQMRNTHNEKVIDVYDWKCDVLYPLQAILNETNNFFSDGTISPDYLSEKIRKLLLCLDNKGLIREYVISDLPTYKKLIKNLDKD